MRRQSKESLEEWVDGEDGLIRRKSERYFSRPGQLAQETRPNFDMAIIRDVCAIL